jgi:hypothetical protein
MYHLNLGLYYLTRRIFCKVKVDHHWVLLAYQAPLRSVIVLLAAACEIILLLGGHLDQLSTPTISAAHTPERGGACHIEPKQVKLDLSGGGIDSFYVKWWISVEARRGGCSHFAHLARKEDWGVF